MSLKFENICLSVKNTNLFLKGRYVDLLKNITGEVDKGEILAILGPSGSGKTTLINALAGRIPKSAITQGTILYNDKKRTKKDWLDRSGFVDQDDVVFGSLTIEETIVFAYKFRYRKTKELFYNVLPSVEEVDKNVSLLMKIGDMDRNVVVVDEEKIKASEEKKIGDVQSQTKQEIEQNSKKDENEKQRDNVNECLSCDIKEYGYNELGQRTETEDTDSMFAIKEKRIKGQNFTDPISAVNKVINDLQLTDVCKNQVKNSSGGERKRTLIGAELISDPEIIFLDEPTSGLDTYTALKICKVLKELAIKQNKIIIMTIHQPSTEIYNLFDKLMVLSNGEVLFYDELANVEGFFKKNNLIKREAITWPEFFIEICSNEFRINNPQLFNKGEVFYKKPFKRSSKAKYKNERFINLIPNLKHTFLILKKRKIILRRNFWHYARAQIFIFAIYMGLLYFNVMQNNKLDENDPNNPWSAFEFKNKMNVPNSIKISLFRTVVIDILLFWIIFSQTSRTISGFYDEIPKIKKEISVNSYSTTSYLFALLIQTIISQMSIPVLSLAIFYYPLRHVINLNVLSVFVFSAFFTVPFGIMIGSISVQKHIVVTLASIFSGIASISPALITQLLLKYGINSDGSHNIICYCTYATILVSPYHFSAMMHWLAYDEVLKQIEKFPNLFKVQIIESLEQFLRYIDLRRMNIYQLIICMVVSPLLCLYIAALLLGRKLMPDLRLRLEQSK